MSDLGSKSALQTDLDAKVTTNGVNENTGARVRAYLTNCIDTMYAAFQAARSELTKLNTATGNVASAGTMDLGATSGDLLTITGTATITALGTADAGVTRKCIAAGAFTLTHHATNLICPG